jgi:hypothetical protein
MKLEDLKAQLFSPAGELRRQMFDAPSEQLRRIWDTNSVSEQVRNEMLEMNRMQDEARGAAGASFPSEERRSEILEMNRVREEARHFSGMGFRAGLQPYSTLGLPRCPEAPLFLMPKAVSLSPYEKQGAHTVINIHGNVEYSQVGTENSTQHNVPIGVDPAALQRIVATLNCIGEQLNLAAESADELRAELQTLEAQAESPRPKAPIISECLKSVRSILEGAAGNAAAAGVLYEIGRLLK